MRPQLRRANPSTGVEEHFCTACDAYHPLSEFNAGVLRHRQYKCRAAALVVHRQYRQRGTAAQRKCRRMLERLRRREMHGEVVQRLEVEDVERAVQAWAERTGTVDWQRKYLSLALVDEGTVTVLPSRKAAVAAKEPQE